MRITCPSCAAAYEVPDERIAPGRNVRCARCGTDWMPLAAVVLAAAPVPLPAAVPGMEPKPIEAVPPLPAAEPPTTAVGPVPPMKVPRPGRGLVAAAWAMSLLLLLVLGWGLYAGRSEVMRAWPPSERLYAAFGMLHSH